MANLNNTKMIDSYEEVLNELSSKIGKKITIDQLFESGMNKIIRIDKDKIDREWEKLKGRIINGRIINKEEDVYVRSHGRNGSGNIKLIPLLKEVFDMKFETDSTNNSKPKSLLKRCCGDEYQNYQISHIFEERTNNPFLFTAPWMVCFTPKIIDPFTGHESKGYPELRRKFTQWAYDTNKKYIENYNKLILRYWKRLKALFDEEKYRDDEKFRERMIIALAPIKLDYELLDSEERKAKYIEEFNKL
ncbi:MAG: hypothetical protein IKY01_05390 [Prevotella sp.]|nr:hypothetical protein [Prevotella sp.]